MELSIEEIKKAYEIIFKNSGEIVTEESITRNHRLRSKEYHPDLHNDEDEIYYKVMQQKVNAGRTILKKALTEKRELLNKVALECQNKGNKKPEERKFIRIDIEETQNEHYYLNKLYYAYLYKLHKTFQFFKEKLTELEKKMHKFHNFSELYEIKKQISDLYKQYFQIKEEISNHYLQKKVEIELYEKVNKEQAKMIYKKYSSNIDESDINEIALRNWREGLAEVNYKSQKLEIEDKFAILIDDKNISELIKSRLIKMFNYTNDLIKSLILSKINTLLSSKDNSYKKKYYTYQECLKLFESVDRLCEKMQDQILKHIEEITNKEIYSEEILELNRIYPHTLIAYVETLGFGSPSIDAFLDNYLDARYPQDPLYQKKRQEIERKYKELRKKYINEINKMITKHNLISTDISQIYETKNKNLFQRNKKEDKLKPVTINTCKDRQDLPTYLRTYEEVLIDKYVEGIRRYYEAFICRYYKYNEKEMSIEFELADTIMNIIDNGKRLTIDTVEEHYEQMKQQYLKKSMNKTLTEDDRIWTLSLLKKEFEISFPGEIAENDINYLFSQIKQNKKTSTKKH